VTLSRNGKDYELTATDIRAGTEIEVTTERPDLSLTLTELDAGSWVIFDLPGFTTAASGMEQGSLDALREASDTSYYKGSDALWVKIVSNGGPNRARTSLDVSR
jgi:cell migration-inducing and hyaluronan-binding protein